MPVEVGAPRVVIIYSHDDDEHGARILALANRLRFEGIDAWIDRYEQSPPEGWPRWMGRQLREARFVLVVCTETYRRRFDREEEPGQGKGATWEGLLAAQSLYEAGTLNTRLVPVLFDGTPETAVPAALRRYTCFRLPAEHDARYRL
jgi:hypothetical protein